MDFDALFLRVKERLLGYARRVLAERHVTGVSAEDVVHTAYVKLRDGPEWLRREERERERVAYVLRSVYNAAIDASRDRGPAPRAPDETVELPALAKALPSSGPVTREDQRRCLRELVASLPKRESQLISLLIDHQLEPKEAAARLGIRRQVARRRYRRAHDTLVRLSRKIRDEC